MKGNIKIIKNEKNMSPSDYCKSILGMKNVKSIAFVKNYFGNMSVLESSLREYRRISKARNNEKTICDLLK